MIGVKSRKTENDTGSFYCPYVPSLEPKPSSYFKELEEKADKVLKEIEAKRKRDAFIEKFKADLAELEKETQQKAEEPKEDKFKKIMMPMIRRIIPGTIAQELCGVQPMSEPVGLIFKDVPKFQLYDIAPSGTFPEHVTEDYIFPHPRDGKGSKVEELPKTLKEGWEVETKPDLDLTSGWDEVKSALQEGMIRWNPDIKTHESWNGTGWVGLSGEKGPTGPKYVSPGVSVTEIDTSFWVAPAGTVRGKLEAIGINSNFIDPEEEITAVLSAEICREIDEDIINRITGC